MVQERTAFRRWNRTIGQEGNASLQTAMKNGDPAKLCLSNFLAGETNDPLQAPPSFTQWMRQATLAIELYEPALLGGADARTTEQRHGHDEESKQCPGSEFKTLTHAVTG